MKPLLSRTFYRMISALFICVFLLPAEPALADHVNVSGSSIGPNDVVRYHHLDGMVLKFRHNVSLRLLTQAYGGVRDDKRDVEVFPSSTGAGREWVLRDAGDGYWYIVNLQTGLVLSEGSQSGPRRSAVNWGRHDQPDLKQHWRFDRNPNNDGTYMIINRASGAGLWQHEGGRDKGNRDVSTLENPSHASGEWSWYPFPGRNLAGLRILTIEKVKAISTSTGQDGATKVLFAGIDLALSVATSGGGVAAAKTAVKTGSLITRAALKKSAQVALKDKVKGLARRKLGVSNADLAKAGLNAAGIGGGGSGGGVGGVTKVANSVMQAMSSEYLFNKIYGNSPDDLDIQVNGVSIFPNGGRDDGRKIKSQQTLVVNKEIIYESARGANIRLVEYDSGSDDDDMGGLHMKEAAGYPFTGVVRFDNVLIQHKGEGSLYELTFRIEPFALEDGALTAETQKVAKKKEEQQKFQKVLDDRNLVDYVGNYQEFAASTPEDFISLEVAGDHLYWTNANGDSWTLKFDPVSARLVPSANNIYHQRGLDSVLSMHDPATNAIVGFQLQGKVGVSSSLEFKKIDSGPAIYPSPLLASSGQSQTNANANANQQGLAQQVPGWNRANVFYQPAFDHCTGALGLDQNGQDYQNCYFAYPNYNGNQQQTAVQPPRGSQPAAAASNNNQQPGGKEPGWDRANVFYQPAFDHCTGPLGLDQNGQDYQNCYYAYPNYNGNQQQTAAQPLGGSQPTAAASNNNQQPGGKEPGWNRADVFFQPAFDHCTGALGLDQNSQDYQNCYFAYPNYNGNQQQTAVQPPRGSQPAAAASNNNQQPGGKEPGWDRANVFYQPAFDHCTGALGLDQNSQKYQDCYYAYPNYNGKQQSGGQEPSLDLNPGRAYSQLPGDVLQSCQGDVSCLDAAVLQTDRANAQGIDNQIGTNYPDLNSDDIARCGAHTYGSSEFFWCLDLVKAEKQQYQQQPDDNQQPLNDNQQPDGQQPDGQEPSLDLNPGGAYSQLPGDVLQSCQGEVSCLDAAVLQADRANAQGIDNLISTNYPDLNSDDIARCGAHTYGSSEFFWCLDLLNAEKQQNQQHSNDNEPQYDENQDQYDESQQQSNDGEQSDGQEPGWNRGQVFYQPAYDHCNGQLGYELNTPDYEECYYAFGN